MDLFEKMNRSFGSWYENLFGGGDDVRPKDILRRIINALEDHRKEGFDNKIYVPNQYILEVNVQDQEEKDYLLSFLDRAELEAAVRRYCQQSRYHIRGVLDFLITEVEGESVPESRRNEKVRVRCRYTTRVGEEGGTRLPSSTDAAPLPNIKEIAPEDRTIASVVAAMAAEEERTVPGIAVAQLKVFPSDRPLFEFSIFRPKVQIGRSKSSDNDIVLDWDGQVSKIHALLERNSQGRYSIQDKGSTNGIRVNGKRVASRILEEGDEILVGTTRMVFRYLAPSESAEFEPDFAEEEHGGGIFGGAAERSLPDGGSSSPPIRKLRSVASKIHILNERGETQEEYALATETAIGRMPTNDIVLSDRSVAGRHARLTCDEEVYSVEAISEAPTTLNGIPLLPKQPIRLADGDVIGIGDFRLRFELRTI